MVKSESKFNQTNYINEYQKQHYKGFSLRIRLDKKEVLEKLESVPSKNAYIISLIEQDIENEKAFKEVKKELSKKALK